MPVLVILILFSLSFYIYYKVKFVRSQRPMEKKWLSAKSSIALGLFVALFGFNQLFLYSTIVTYIVAAIFLLIGGSSAFVGIKAYRHYFPYMVQESEDLKN